MKFLDDEKLISAIADACRGLIYVSETDSPLEPVSFGVADGDKPSDYLAAMGKSTDERFEEVPADEFFQRLTRIEEWYTEAERDRARRFRNLFQLMNDNLSDIRIFRFGRIRIDIFIVGRAKSGRLIGVRTFAVET